MKVVTAVEKLEGPRPWVFLAGGITNCPWWQDEVIVRLEGCEGTLLNPRRRDFPIGDPNAAKEQITWEFNALEKADIFSMWFSNADSDQPICMYELGRHLALFPMGYLSSVCIGVEPGYRRSQDVYIQTKLILPYYKIADTLDQHANNVRVAVADIVA